MRKLICSIVGMSALLICVNLAHSGEDARTFLAKAIEASGGEKAIEKHSATTFKEKGTFHGVPDMALPYTGSYAIQYPDKFRMEIEGVFTIVLNGDKGWISAMGEVKAMDKDQVATQQIDYKAGYMSSLLPLKDKAFALTMLPDAKVGKQNASVLLASRKGWPEVKFFFDKKTTLLVRMEYKSKAADMGFKDIMMDNNFSEFKAIDGVQVPHKMVMNRDGKVFVESELLEMKTGKIDPKTFDQPK